MAEMVLIMQSLGQATCVPVQLSAPPLPTPIPTATPVNMKVHFSLVLRMYVGLRAVVIIGVRAIVDVGVRVVVDVGLRAVLSYRFWKPPHAGEVMPKFLIESNLFVFLDYYMQSLSSKTVFPDYSHMQSLLLCAASVRGFQ
jgi:hypothetical protein